MNPIKRLSLHEEIVTRVRDLILEGDLKPGSKVPERELCEQFDVSRTPMREALKVLAIEGLVTLKSKRGAWVSELTIKELEEVFPVMGALEILAAQLACAAISPAQLTKLKKLHDRMVWAYEHTDRATYFLINEEIHDSILEIAGNATLTEHYNALSRRVRRARYMAKMSPEHWKRSVTEHAQMLQALKDRDSEALCAVVSRHIQSKFETVAYWFQSSEHSS